MKYQVVLPPLSQNSTDFFYVLAMSNSFQKLGNDIEIQHNQTISSFELQLLRVSSNNLNLIRGMNCLEI